MPTRKELEVRYWMEEDARRRAQKPVRRAHKPERVRERTWRELDAQAIDPLDTPDFLETERVKPRAARERRPAPTARPTGSPEAAPAGRRGIIIEVSSGICRVESQGEILLCRPRGVLNTAGAGYTNLLAVGDEVLLTSDGAGGAIDAVLPRRSVLARPDVFASHLLQVVVANVDQLLIVAAWRNPPIWLELVDRYLISAVRNGLDPIICVNKIDLAEDQEEYRTRLQPYVDLGRRVLFVSTHTGEGIDEIRRLLTGRTSALAGLSGVGKSSLLKAVQPDLHLRVGAVSEQSGEGRHTTTQVSLQRLAGGGYVVDTPGIREFGLSGLHRAELIQYFPDLAEAARGCRFASCTHLSESDCAVRAALQRGQVSPDRYHSYTKILESLP